MLRPPIKELQYCIHSSELCIKICSVFVGMQAFSSCLSIVHFSRLSIGMERSYGNLESFKKWHDRTSESEICSSGGIGNSDEYLPNKGALSRLWSALCARLICVGLFPVLRFTTCANSERIGACNIPAYVIGQHSILDLANISVASVWRNVRVLLGTPP